MGGWRGISAGDVSLRRCWIFGWLTLVAGSLVFAAGGQTASVNSPMKTAPPIHVNVRLVNVFANVTDAKGAPVGGLTQEDFAICEDGSPQKIAYFERETNVPLSIVLAIDTSGSTRKDLPLEKSAARDFVHWLLRPVDRLDLMDFNSDVREVVPFTADARRIDAGLNDLDVGPATALYDAIYLASQSLAPRHGRKVLVLVTDGDNTKEGMDFSQTLEAARRSGVMIYSIIDLPIPADAGRDTDGEHAMITMSQETGGQYFYAKHGDLREAFQKVSEILRTQYLLAYYPDTKARAWDAPDSQFRSISVTLTHPPQGKDPYMVQNRTGYYPEN
jgi:Ca-activated chloride channel homolog